MRRDKAQDRVNTLQGGYQALLVLVVDFPPDGLWLEAVGWFGSPA